MSCWYRRRFALLTTVVVLLLAGCGKGGGSEPKAEAPPKTGGDTVKIGALWAISGIAQSFGKNSSAVFKKTLDDINSKGGVELADGRRLRLEGTVYDEGCPSPETGIAATRKAADDPVIIMLGPNCSSVAEPVYGILQKTLDDPKDTGLQLPFFTDGAIKANLARISPWAFRNVPSEVEMYAGLFQHLRETTPYKTVGVGTEVDFAHSKSTSDTKQKLNPFNEPINHMTERPDRGGSGLRVIVSISALIQMYLVRSSFVGGYLSDPMTTVRRSHSRVWTVSN